MMYKTVAAAASDEFTEKRSRFIGHVRPTVTQDEAVQFINEVKSTYWDATHNVYAYCLRDGQSRRYSDDGEPQGTAGIPTLDVLLKEELTDCTVVVTRYFGGILLGTGGLVRAYSHAAKLAVTAGSIITMRSCDVLEVDSDYNFYGRLSSLIPECEGVIERTDYTDTVTVIFRIPCEITPLFEAKLTDLSFGKLKSRHIGEKFCAFS